MRTIQTRKCKENKKKKKKTGQEADKKRGRPSAYRIY